jgi:hypothetical protein
VTRTQLESRIDAARARAQKADRLGLPDAEDAWRALFALEALWFQQRGEVTS